MKCPNGKAKSLIPRDHYDEKICTGSADTVIHKYQKIYAHIFQFKCNKRVSIKPELDDPIFSFEFLFTAKDEHIYESSFEFRAEIFDKLIQNNNECIPLIHRICTSDKET